ALTCQYPRLRNTLLRVTEPLGAADNEDATAEDQRTLAAGPGVAIAMDNVGVSVGSHPLLADLNLSIAPGQHVAIVGTSGSGKSSLAGLLLGWNRPTSGELTMDGGSLDATTLATLRRDTVWISPEVHLWNRSLLDNILYGATDGAVAMSDVLDAAALI